ncbi:hypothetical protein XU18_0100 [Perkinsela sp. CCAP 1560/4]|nr:hypothetical protein XU18_0100 [Perkinsela sp. CCAP 1560/4]|eukprot:KNH09415.1 hypothetical protein XU18_0100 [Perkinsela sp. CCAP 1560/4]
MISGGKLPLELLPEGLFGFESSEMGFEGTLQTRSLPRSLLRLCINSCSYYGTFDVAGLPSDIRHVYISNNDHQGTLALFSLGDSVVELDACENKFSGPIDMTRLPPNLVLLKLSSNAFTADPMEGHLFVVGWTSTPSWGNPGAFQTLVVFLFWRRPYRRPPQGGGSGPVPIHGEVQETAVSCYGGFRILLVARGENVHSFSAD